MEFEDKKKNKKKMKENPSSPEETLRDSGKLNHIKVEQPEREIRSDLIYIVKKRINSGYYKSAPIIEEMVEYFAKVFDSPQ